MSENFPFAPVEEESSGDRKKMVLVAGVGALAIAVLGYFVVVPALAGGEDAAPVTAVRKAPPKATKAKSKAAKKADAKKKPAARPESYSDVSARAHPFRPLWEEPVAAVADPAAVPGAPGAPAAPAPGAPAPGAPAGSGSGSSANVGGQRVGLVTVYSKDGVHYAQTRVGDMVHTPKVGEVFATQYKLLAVNGKTATYLYGDEQFTLSVGQEVLK